jgi:hypothetical protein
MEVHLGVDIAWRCGRRSMLAVWGFLNAVSFFLLIECPTCMIGGLSAGGERLELRWMVRMFITCMLHVAHGMSLCSLLVVVTLGSCMHV